MTLQQTFMMTVAVSLFIAGCGRPPVPNPREITQSVPAVTRQTETQPFPISRNDDEAAVEPERIRGFGNDFIPFPASNRRIDPLLQPWRSRVGLNDNVEKHCGACGKQVSNSSTSGMICPHCGVRWNIETDQKRFPF